MKRIVRLIIVFILFVPLFVFAKYDSFNGSTIDKTNNYIKSDNYKNREKFLIFKSPMYFKLTKNTVGTDTRFVTGGMLNKDEYELSIRDNNSYLATGIEYWTMTEVNSSSQYYIENYLKYKEKILTSNIRVTEIVKPEAEVTGNGSYVNPWVFNTRPLVTIRTNSKDYGRIDNQLTSSRYAIEVGGNSSNKTYYVEFKLTPTKGYEYEGHDGCRLVNLNTVDGGNTFENMYRINNVIDDMDCTAVFRLRTWNLTLKSNEGYSRNPSPATLYFKYKTGWYTNSGLSSGFSKLSTLPTRAGYSFEGYKFGSTEVIDKNGNLKVDKNTTIFNETKNNNQNLIAQWSACPAGYYASASDPVCKICPAGTYSKGAAPSCTPCPAGQYQPSQGKDTCILCPKGQHQNETGKTSCVACPVGQHQDTEGQANCKACPTGQFQATPGAVNCTPCPVGQYQSNQGQTGCTACPAGQYQDETGKSSCKACPKGQYQNATGQTSCKNCPTGQYQDLTGQNSCKNCSAGQYQNETGKSSCKGCPSDQWSNAGASGCFSKCSRVNYTVTSTCSASCGGGSKRRLAYSYYDSGYRCSGSDDWSGGSCNTQGCCSSTWTSYGGWSGWGGCSRSCGGGTQYRTRSWTKYSNYNGQNCGSGTETGSQSCNTHSCTCTVYCTAANGCSIYRPTNWDAVYGVFSCDPSTGTTGAMEACWVNFAHPGGIACNRGFNDAGKWWWMCTNDHRVNCDNWGGLTETCNKSLTCGNVDGTPLRRRGGYDCSCSW